MDKSIVSQVFNYNSFVHAFAGLVGGATAISVFYPLNYLRSKLQVEDKQREGGVLTILKDIIDKEGFQALYQGWQSSVICLGASNFVYFYTYNLFKKLIILELKSGLPSDIKPIPNLIIASVAGCLNVLLTGPLWVANTRLTVQNAPAKGGHGHGGTDGKESTKDGTEKEAKKAEKKEKKADEVYYTGIFHVLSDIAKKQGIWAIWQGLIPSLILVSNPSVQFVTYENLKKFMSKIAASRKKPITSIEFFIMGAIAKAVATVVTYPLQVAQSRLRAGKASTTVGCLLQILKDRGVAGWFYGMEAKLWQTVLTAAFQFLTYEEIAKLVFSVMAGKTHVPGSGGH